MAWILQILRRKKKKNANCTKFSNVDIVIYFVVNYNMQFWTIWCLMKNATSTIALNRSQFYCGKFLNILPKERQFLSFSIFIQLLDCGLFMFVFFVTENVIFSLLQARKHSINIKTFFFVSNYHCILHIIKFTPVLYCTLLCAFCYLSSLIVHCNPRVIYQKLT